VSGYRITDAVRRVSIDMDRPGWDPREQRVYSDTESRQCLVRDMRLLDLEQTWLERSLTAFDHLVLMWHRYDPRLYLHLSDVPKLRAINVLRKAGYLGE